MSRSTAATVSNRLLFDYHPHEMLDRAFPMSRFYTEDPPHQLSLTLATGRTAAYASDGPGASFFAYIPTTHPLSQLRQTGSLDHVIPPSGAFPLVILVHGSDRDAESLRNRWADWAETRKVVLLAPLFPIHGEVSLIAMLNECGDNRRVQRGSTITSRSLTQAMDLSCDMMYSS